MKLLINLTILITLIKTIDGLELTDFNQNFIVKKNENSRTRNFKPLVYLKQNLKMTSWYCTHVKNPELNIFCGKKNTNEVEDLKLNHINDSDQTKINDSSAFNNYTQSNLNQAALQDQKSLEYRSKQNNLLLLPIQPNSNLNVNVGQQQIEINIKY